MSRWEDVLSLEDEEYVVASWGAVLSKEGEYIQNKRMKSPKLVLTNRRLAYLGKEKLFGGTYEFLLSIPLESIKVLITGGRFIKHIKIHTAEGEYQAHYLAPEGIKLPNDKRAEYFKEKVLEQIRERRRELEAKKMPVVMDFSFLRAFIEKGGIVLTTLKCPHCSAPIKMPKGGTETVCEHCGSTVYAQDIFEKVKKLIE